MINLIRRIRHNHLRKFNNLFLTLGNIYRTIIQLLGSPGYISHHIGKYGPFKLDSYFAFSNFSDWGGSHNGGFETLINLSKNKNCILDIGAHIGLVTLPLSSQISLEGFIHSFEPSDINRKYLEKHIQLNKLNNVKIVDFLVGNKNIDQVPFYETSVPNGKNSVIQNLHSNKLHKKQITIDNYCQENELVPDIIKIDVEGYEMYVLDGCKETMKVHKPLIILSVHPSQIIKLNKNPNHIKIFAIQNNYKIKKIVGKFDFKEFDEFELAEYMFEPIRLK